MTKQITCDYCGRTHPSFADIDSHSIQLETLQDDGECNLEPLGLEVDLCTACVQPFTRDAVEALKLMMTQCVTLKSTVGVDIDAGPFTPRRMSDTPEKAT